MNIIVVIVLQSFRGWIHFSRPRARRRAAGPSGAERVCAGGAGTAPDLQGLDLSSQTSPME